MNDSSFTLTTLVAAAAAILEEAGFRALDAHDAPKWSALGARVYEDAYSVVGVVVYDTWTDLADHWTEVQGALVELISEHLSRDDAKAWEGYLVLLTPGVVPSSDRLRAIAIQRNTTHLRKLFAGGEELRTVDDVRRVLLPLLPLDADTSWLEPRDVLELLPRLLALRGINEESVRVAVRAFLDQQPIVERINELLTDQREQQR